MSKEDELERKTMMGIIPARPKGAPAGPTAPPPLDDLLKRRQTMSGPTRLNFVDEPEPEVEIPDTVSVEFETFMEILRLLRSFPKKARKQLIKTIAELVD